MARQEGHVDASPKSFSFLTGQMVMEGASLASWFTNAFAFIKDLLRLFKGPSTCIHIEPRNIYDSFTYQALRLGHTPPVSNYLMDLKDAFSRRLKPRSYGLQADETVQMLCRIALGPLWAMGYQNDMLFRQESKTDEEESMDNLASTLVSISSSRHIFCGSLY